MLPRPMRAAQSSIGYSMPPKPLIRLLERWRACAREHDTITP
jgi:hypothetical protein